MSIKIYNGYRIPATDLFTLLNQCRDLKPKLAEDRKVVLRGQIKNIEEYKEKRFTTQINIDESNRKGYQHPYDFSLDICFFPTKDFYLYITFPGRYRHEKIIQEHFESEFFGYWNNVDPDEKCSEVQWEDRKRLWNEVLLEGKNGIPGQHGFTITILDACLPMPEKLYKDVEKS